MKLSVIITTYKAEQWLKKVLIGFQHQREKDFEVIIADDGSGPATKKVIDEFNGVFNYPIKHIWHEDLGFRKSMILNKAIAKSESEYLLFTDGDCIPREDFISVHLKMKKPGYFLSGGYYKLPLHISNLITEKDIKNQNCFNLSWLIKNKININFKLTKFINFSFFNTFMDWVTPTKKSWNGHNSSGFKKDILAVNGFNEEMNYGGMDREIGERMFNNDILSKQIRYRAICIHLDHKRSYSSSEMWKKNNMIRAYNRQKKITFIEKGVSQYTNDQND